MAKLELNQKLIFALCGLALALTSCGAKTTMLKASSDQASSAPRGTTPSTNLPTTVVGAECGQFAASTGRLSGKMRTYYDASNQMQEDLIRVRLTSVDSKMDTQNNIKIRFYRWNASQDGVTNLDSAPLRFRVEYRSGAGATPVSSYLDYLTQADVTAIANAYSGLSATPSEFLKQVDLVVSDLAYTWQVLKIVMYEDGATLAMADGLLPIYIANPNTYATTHASVLNGLHPLWADRGSNQSDTYYLNSTQSYCF